MAEANGVSRYADGAVLVGVGNVTILWALAGMFIGAYLQGYWRSRS